MRGRARRRRRVRAGEHVYPARPRSSEPPERNAGGCAHPGRHPKPPPLETVTCRNRHRDGAGFSCHLEEMRRDQALQLLRDNRASLARLCVARLFLYGSVARDHASAQSDMDVFTRLNNGENDFAGRIRTHRQVDPAPRLSGACPAPKRPGARPHPRDARKFPSVHIGFRRYRKH